MHCDRIAGECPYAFRSFRRFGNAGVLCASQNAVVRAVVPRFVRSRVRVWLSPRGLAVWVSRGDLVGRCLSPLAHGSEVLNFKTSLRPTGSWSARPMVHAGEMDTGEMAREPV